MKTVEELNNARDKKVLKKQINYGGIGILTRKEFVEYMLSEGAHVEINERKKYQYNRTKFNRMNHRQQAEYEKKLEETVTKYEMHREDGVFYEITRAEYNYFNKLKEGSDRTDKPSSKPELFKVEYLK